jgi:SAM-dependent methyltransferase
MVTHPPPKANDSLRFFFEERASTVSRTPSVLEQCWVSGREPRLWTQPDLYQDLIESIRDQLDLGSTVSALEVGCAAGFLATGLAPLCGHYTGIDLSPAALDRACSLGLANASFRVEDATALTFPDSTFDRVIGYDVFTNFESFELCRSVMSEMVRVLRPGGRVLVGSLADESRKEPFLRRVEEVNRSLHERFGPAPRPPGKPRWRDRLRFAYWKKLRGVEPLVVCYYFRKGDFQAFGDQLGLGTRILDIHEKNPYFSYRFNVVFTKPA